MSMWGAAMEYSISLPAVRTDEVLSPVLLSAAIESDSTVVLMRFSNTVTGTSMVQEVVPKSNSSPAALSALFPSYSYLVAFAALELTAATFS